jgi:1-acyl-sn-glycerol-3-phosphate acyltransferase
VSFKCLFKNSLIYAPGIGSTLLLSGHISVDRSDKNSARSALARAEEALNAGSNVVFFVEGTRKIDTTAGPLGDFKPGAFIAAQHAQVPLVPMTISGARRLFPPGIRLLFGDVTITVHPPLPPPVRGSDEASTRAAIDESISKAKRIIASGLREWDHVVADASGSVEHVKTVASGSSRSVGAAASKQSTPAAGSDAVPSVTSEAVKKD